MTTETTPTIPAGYRADAQGRLVPEKMIPEHALLRDDLVRQLIERVDAASTELATLKGCLLAGVSEHVALVASDYDTTITGKGGDVRLDSYDGLLRVERATGRRLRVTEEIHAAEQLVRDYLDTEGVNVPDGYRAITDRTFRRNNKTGELSVSRLIDFVAVKIDDPRWKAAQRAIRDAIQNDGTTVYFRAYRRGSVDEPWQQIPLDFSTIRPAAQPTAGGDA